jgi:hypothetical protein
VAARRARTSGGPSPHDQAVAIQPWTAGADEAIHRSGGWSTTAAVAARTVASSTRSARTVGTSSTEAPRRWRRSTCSWARRSAVTATVQPARGSIRACSAEEIAEMFRLGLRTRKKTLST